MSKELLQSQGELELNGTIDEVQKIMLEYVPSQQTRNKDMMETIDKISTAIINISKEDTKSNIISKVPFIGNYLSSKLDEEKRERMRNTKVFIEEASNTLRRGKQTLYQDNIVLNNVKEALEKNIKQRQVKIEAMQKQLDELNNEIVIDSDDPTLVIERTNQDTLKHTLLQDIVDQQNQLAVEVNSFCNIDVIMRTNYELSKRYAALEGTALQTLHLSLIIDNTLSDRKEMINFVTTLDQQAKKSFHSVTAKTLSQTKEIQELTTKTVMDAETLRKSIENIKKANEETKTFVKNNMPKLIQIATETGNIINELKNIKDVNQEEFAKLLNIQEDTTKALKGMSDA